MKLHNTFRSIENLMNSLCIVELSVIVTAEVIETVVIVETAS